LDEPNREFYTPLGGDGSQNGVPRRRHPGVVGAKSFRGALRKSQRLPLRARDQVLPLVESGRPCTRIAGPGCAVNNRGTGRLRRRVSPPADYSAAMANSSSTLRRRRVTTALPRCTKISNMLGPLI